MRFSLSADRVSRGDFIVTDGTASPPRVDALSIDGPQVAVSLSSTIQPGRWTDITYQPTGTRVRIGYLPGDVNNDGRTGPHDIMSLIDVLNGSKSLPEFCTDIDRNGQTNPSDLVALVEFISGINKRGGQKLAAR